MPHWAISVELGMARALKSDSYALGEPSRHQPGLNIGGVSATRAHRALLVLRVFLERLGIPPP